jgi:hypothetical protein
VVARATDALIVEPPDTGFRTPDRGDLRTRQVSAVVLEVLAPQLGLLPMPITDYPRDEKTRWTHLERIRRHLGFVRRDRGQRQLLLEHLTSDDARGAPRTESLRRTAHTWLLEHHVVRPRRTTLRDLVATARETGLQQTFDALTRDVTEAQPARRTARDGLRGQSALTERRRLPMTGRLMRLALDWTGSKCHRGANRRPCCSAYSSAWKRSKSSALPTGHR